MNAIQPFAKHRSFQVSQDVLSLEKITAITLYYLKYQRPMKMTANTTGIAHSIVLVVVHEICQFFKWKHWSANYEVSYIQAWSYWCYWQFSTKTWISVVLMVPHTNQTTTWLFFFQDEPYNQLSVMHVENL